MVFDSNERQEFIRNTSKKINETKNNTLESFKVIGSGNYSSNTRGMGSNGRFTTNSVDHV